MKITGIYIYAVLTFIVTITRRFICNVTVIVIITGRSICSVNSYCENNGNIYICSANSYCDNNCEIYM